MKTTVPQIHFKSLQDSIETQWELHTNGFSKEKHIIIEPSYFLAHVTAGLTTRGVLCSTLVPYFKRENDKLEHRTKQLIWISLSYDKW